MRHPEPDSWSDDGVTIAWLGHAAVLLNFYGVRVLTDPTLFPRVGVDVCITTVGLPRLTSCALTASELPPIDLVLLSHAHFDHFDRRSLRKVPGRPAVVTAWATSDLLPRRRRFASVHEMRWGDEVRIDTPRGDIEVRAIEVKHWGARLGRDTHRGYNGYVLRREGRAILFGGDTAYTPAFASHRRFGPYDAAIMPIGGYNPYIHAHCTPEQAVAMADAAGAQLFVPIHHKTFRLSREPVDEPIERTEAALFSESERLVVRNIGDTARVV